MDVVTTITSARARRSLDLERKETVVLVPTMGSLHEGHLSLVRRARELGTSVWVSVFVNPAQFGPDEDLDRYPRDLARDAELVRAEGAAVVFAPTVADMYPHPQLVTVGFSGLENVLCGVHRTGHFAGVGLVVAKLFNIVQPSVAVFGQKDAQQAALIRRLATDLDFPIRIEVAPTVREHDGLAMSSRNTYLSPDHRRAAPAVFRALQRAGAEIAGGERDPARVRGVMVDAIDEEPLLSLEYAVCISQEDFAVPEKIDAPVLLALAVHAGPTRLIDNMPVTPPAVEE